MTEKELLASLAKSIGVDELDMSVASLRPVHEFRLRVGRTYMKVEINQDQIQELHVSRQVNDISRTLFEAARVLRAGAELADRLDLIEGVILGVPASMPTPTTPTTPMTPMTPMTPTTADRFSVISQELMEDP